jgi:hypothetical protein
MAVILDKGVDWDAIDYLIVPKFLPRANLCHSAVLLYALLLEHGFRRTKVRHSELGDRLRVSERQIRNLVTELTKAGFVEVVRRGLGEPNDYRLLGPNGHVFVDAQKRPRRLDCRGLNRELWRQTRLEVLQERGTICVYCGVDAGEHAHVDHVEPLSKGGTPYDKSNLAVACGPCNARKRDRPVEYMQ